ncbi:iron complex outermembrane receptor protein [Gillisia mitskevichiae]|uniref:Iron complex outermembrane receptor protein n=1 Tax=Gillisia mitskevichiae TaxID=270921 RepID=A0A495PLZ3_9FLAO|nr:TonB-dependent receptor [Gillisia mitskevichiae]RKS50715.1 iron complex outermembrane receptor protein [Gillisia mitskevichiae]
MKKTIKKLNFLLLIFCIPIASWAQTSVTGKIIDEKGEGVPFATVMEEGTTNGTTTDEVGNFEFNVSKLPTTIVGSYIGFKTKKQEITAATNIVMTLAQDSFGLDEIVVTGQGTKPRTILDSPVPVDNFGVKELTTSGKPTLDKMLMFKVPSFNSSNQAISDATAHYDPADLRGLGPSRTLVLVNGKRKNQSAQVYLNRTPGKGEVGVDLKSIPTAAIERVEVLRDGASAQYGSDAIGGVINMILKKNVEYTTVTATTGITSEGDGFTFGSDLNTAFNFGDGGYVNLTLGYYKQNTTNRAGTPGTNDPGAERPQEIQWQIDNPDLGMHVGQPAMEKTDIFVNMSHPLGEKGEFYTFHGYTTRTGQSFAYYRAPYWRRDVADAGFLTSPEDFVGYQPTFEAKINDHINVMGVKYDLGENWNADASATYGANSVSYTVNNSVNRDYLADNGTSPTTFHPGGYRLQNMIGNFNVGGSLVENVNVGMGLEYKKEYFDAFEGDPFSYYKGGSDSFAGVKPAEAGSWDRSNFAAFALVDYDVSDALLLGAAARYEDYSDFGDNFSFKVNGRFKLGEKGAVRASYSTGFRAPTLHQRYLTNSQYIIIAGISEPFLQGTLANDNPAVQALGVKSLFAETSRNLSAGVTYKFSNNFYGSIDFYQIEVDDRVLLSSQIGSDGDDETRNPVEQILDDNNVRALQFFVNAGNTTTTGADIVLNYKNYSGGFGASFAANFNNTEIDAITTPAALAENGYNIFAREEKALIEDARPKYKLILGLNKELNKWNIALNNTVFGSVTIRHPEASPQGIDQELPARLITDFVLTYNFTDKLSITGVANNLFDVYPELTDPNTFTSEAGARFPHSSEVQQQGLLGANFRVGLNYQF